MKFQDWFDIHCLFNPAVYYSGETLLGGEFDLAGAEHDYLALNALVNNKENMYLKFLEKYYYRPLAKILNSESMAHTIFPKICTGSDIKANKRKVTFAFSCFLAPQIINFNAASNIQELNELGEDVSITELIVFLKKVIRKERSYYQDVQDNGRHSKYYHEVYSTYIEQLSNGLKMSFEVFLQTLIDGCTKRVVATRSYEEFFSKEINVDELIGCFDYDRLCLVGAQSVLDTCLTTESLKEQVDNAVVYLRMYIEAVEKFRKINPHYSCNIVTIDRETGRKKKVTIDDIIRAYEDLLTRHPNFKFVELNPLDIAKLLKRYGYDDEFIANFDYQSNDVDELFKLLTKIDEDKKLFASWSIIPKGTKKDKVESDRIRREHEERFSLEENEKVRRMLIGRNFLESSNYLFRLAGINEFVGYIGYIYPNNCVVFEKFYDDVEQGKVASGNATYIMSLDNFLEVSKLSKMDIIRKINNHEISGVTRVFHREDMDKWKSQVSQAISGDDYTDEVVNYIETLVGDKIIGKKGVKA